MKTFHLTNAIDVVLVDDQDGDLFLTYVPWYQDNDGYVRTNLRKETVYRVGSGEISSIKVGKAKSIKLHRVIADAMGMINGEYLGPVTFKDGNKMNCQRNNLIPFVNGQHRKRGKTGVQGVSMLGEKYLVSVWDPKGAGNRGKLINYGLFETLEEAKVVAEEAIEKRRLKYGDDLSGDLGVTE